MKNQSSASETVKMTWILWGALLGSIFVYGITAAFITQNPDREATDPETLTMMFYALSAVSVLVFPVIIFFRKQMLSKPIQNGAFKSVDDLRKASFTPYLTSWALSESVAIYGFLLTFLSFDMNYYYGFASLSLVYMVIFRPNYNALEEDFYRENPEFRE